MFYATPYFLYKFFIKQQRGFSKFDTVFSHFFFLYMNNYSFMVLHLQRNNVGNCIIFSGDST